MFFCIAFQKVRWRKAEPVFKPQDIVRGQKLIQVPAAFVETADFPGAWKRKRLVGWNQRIRSFHIPKAYKITKIKLIIYSKSYQVCPACQPKKNSQWTAIMSADGCGKSRRSARVCRIMRQDFPMSGAIFVAPLISRYCARPQGSNQILTMPTAGL